MQELLGVTQGMQQPSLSHFHWSMAWNIEQPLAGAVRTITTSTVLQQRMVDTQRELCVEQFSTKSAR